MCNTCFSGGGKWVHSWVRVPTADGNYKKLRIQPSVGCMSWVLSGFLYILHALRIEFATSSTLYFVWFCMAVGSFLRAASFSLPRWLQLSRLPPAFSGVFILPVAAFAQTSGCFCSMCSCLRFVLSHFAASYKYGLCVVAVVHSSCARPRSFSSSCCCHFSLDLSNKNND